MVDSTPARKAQHVAVYGGQLLGNNQLNKCKMKIREKDKVTMERMWRWLSNKSLVG